MKKAAYATIKSLYGELEAARREWESEGELPWKERSAGGQAYELWTELLWLAAQLNGWSWDPLEDAVGGDSSDVVDDDHDGGDDSPEGPGESLPSGQVDIHQAAGLGSPMESRADERFRAARGVDSPLGGLTPGITMVPGKRKVPRG